MIREHTEQIRGKSCLVLMAYKDSGTKNVKLMDGARTIQSHETVWIISFGKIVIINAVLGIKFRVSHMFGRY
jgi:hypothetical protein